MKNNESMIYVEKFSDIGMNKFLSVSSKGMFQITELLNVATNDDHDQKF